MFETFQILRNIEGFEEISRWAAYHHEEPDGTGYPFRLSAEAMPFMIALSRLPDLNSVSCLTRYSGCWPWMIGLAAEPREPSAVWQALHTWVAMASPFTRSAFAAGLDSEAASGVAMAAAASRARSDLKCDFMMKRPRGLAGG